MRIKKFQALLFSLIIFSCSKTDNDISNGNNSALRDISVFAKDISNTIQFDVLNNTETVNSTSLTSSIGLPQSYFYFEEDFPLITFYDGIFINSVLNIYQHNISNSDSFVAPNFCVLDFEEYPQAATSNEDKIIFITSESDSQNNAFQLFVRIFDKQTTDCIKIPIGLGEVFYFKTALYAEKDLLYVHFITNTSETKIISIDLNSNQIANELTIEDNSKITIKGDELLVFKGTGSELDIYSKLTFEFIETRDANFLISGLAGFFKNTIYQDEMLVNFSYPQPSALAFAPATVSLTTGDYVRGADLYLFDVNNALKETYPTGIDFTCFAVNIETNEVIAGFRDYSQDFKGGVVYSNFNGEVRKVVEFDAIPFHITIR